MRSTFTNPEDIRRFLLAGNATVTLVSKRTGKRFTYKIRRSQADDFLSRPKHFVRLLTGSCNETGFEFLGVIKYEKIWIHSHTSRVTAEAPGARAWKWFWYTLLQGRVHPELEVWHEGKCGRCGRKLTVPSSIANGIGPECQQQMMVPGLLAQMGAL